jgi:glycolate oxidase|tara:strand:+ start:200 stop:1594 length:1395 start_codon:yes stop_codon:yes gene_type:complete
MSDSIYTIFSHIISSDRLHESDEVLSLHSRDETEDLYYRPCVVAEPVSAEEVSALVKAAHKNNIPVTAAGARTGLSGGALAVNGGLALSLRRMNKILKIDEINHQAIVQPGVITEVLQNAVAEKNLFYAVDPASKGTCTLGGNLAENSGGPRAVKYGVTKDWVLNLEVVLADGSIIETGANTLKNSTGYNLTGLMVGSEGTLGIITQATLKLLPLPKFQALMLVPFHTAESACEAVAKVFQAGVIPSAMEFMEKDALALTQTFTGNFDLDLNNSYKAYLLVEADGFEESALMPQCEKMLPIFEALKCGDILFATSSSEQDKLWYLRRRMGEAVKAESIYKEEDTVVPRGCLPQLLASVKRIGDDYGFRSICYGHAGDGNLHVNILRDELSDEFWDKKLPQAIAEIFTEVKALGGTLSGEHGIGLVQTPYMHLVCSKAHLKAMKAIKTALDPKGILNPGKILPED